MAPGNAFGENTRNEIKILSNIVSLEEKLQNKMVNFSESLSKEYYNKFLILDQKITDDLNAAKKYRFENVVTAEHSVKLPNIEYDGRTSPSDFLNNLDRFANENGWEEQAKVGYIISSLRGPAAEVLLDLTDEECLNYKILLQSLHKKHEIYAEERRKVTEFFKRKQMPGENVVDYGADVKRLGKEVLKGTSVEILSFYIVKQFLVGLANTKLIHDTTANIQFNDIDEAIAQIAKNEDILYVNK